jgi:WD40 repeat protein/uncharacterized caspase-like protein
MKSAHLIFVSLLLGHAAPAAAQVGVAPDKRLVVEDGRYEESGWSRQLAVTTDDRYLVASDTKHGVRIFDLETGILINSMEGHSLEGDAYYDARAGILVTTGDRTIKIWDVPRQKLLKRIRQAFHSQFMQNVYIDSARKYVFAQGVKYSFATGNVIKVYQQTGIDRLADRYFYQDRYYVFDRATGQIRSYDCSSDQQVASYTLEKYRDGVDVYFDDAGGRLFVGYPDGVRIVDIASGRSDFAAFDRSGAFSNLDQTATYAISVDGNYLVAGSNQGVGLVVVSKIAPGAGFAGNSREVMRQPINVGEVHALNASNKVVYSVSESIHLLDLETMQQRWSTEWRTLGPRNIHLAPDGGEVYIDLGSQPRVNRHWFGRTFKYNFDDYFDSIDANWGSFKADLTEADLPIELVQLWRQRPQEVRMPLNRDLRIEPFSGTRPFSSYGTTATTVAPVDGPVESPSGRFSIETKSFGASSVYDRGKLLGRTRDLGVIYHVEYSPDERFVALGGSLRRVDVIDLSTGRTLWGLAAESYVTTVTFSRDGQHVFTGSLKNEILMWRLSDGKLLRKFVGSNGSINDTEISNDGKHLLSVAEDGALRFWSVSTGELLLTVLFPMPTEWDAGAQRPWVVVAPDGRFDTNRLDEIRGLHWIMMDDPLRPVPLEIFMRDYYEPRLLGRVLGGETLPPLPRLDQLNRAQPRVAIRDVRLEDEKRGHVSVTVDVGRELESGAYDLRLFRDGQIVAQMPETQVAPTAGEQTRDQELADWRRTHEIVLDPASGRRTVTFGGIRLPRRAGLGEVEFSAYAFNVDRVKSATARTRMAVPKALSPLPGRAYVVTVGVNAFESAALRQLSYAANDANEFAAVLSAKLQGAKDPTTGVLRFGPSQVVTVRLITDGDAGRAPAVNHATKDRIKAVLERLAGKAVAPERLAGIANAGDLRAAEPEDLVVVSFSTHGDTDRRGQFYLMPYDVGPVGELASIRQHAISSEELSGWLRTLDAGELVMIVDACHSAATVESPEFKPGPMGSRGLGQLAFDKGMRILAASQRDQYALETETTRQGLLSYALVREGLKDEAADAEPRDMYIHLAEWLRYGASRVPGLYRDYREGKLKARAATPLDAPEAKNFISIQQPALFDFARRRDVVIASVSDRR